MAGSDFSTSTSPAKGAHGAMPENSCDPIMIGAALARNPYRKSSAATRRRCRARRVDHQVQRRQAYNIIPETAHLAGTIRIFDDKCAKLVERRMRELVAGMAAALCARRSTSDPRHLLGAENADEQTDAIAQKRRGTVRRERW